MLRSYFFTFSSFLWLGLITVLSLIDPREPEKMNREGGLSEDITLPSSVVKFIVTVGFDSILHALAYALAGVLFVLFLWERFRSRMTLKRSMLYTVIFLVAYGIVLEVIQMNFTLRSGELTDVIANVIGASAGVWFAGLMFKALPKLNWEN